MSNDKEQFSRHRANASARPANVTALVGARELHGEVLDPSTGNVWQSLEPITREEYEALARESVRLASDWVLRLPTPTSVLFFRNGDSYQGRSPSSRATVTTICEAPGVEEGGTDEWIVDLGCCRRDLSRLPGVV